MMSRAIVLKCLLVAVLVAYSIHGALAKEAKDYFADALYNESTSPSYILITVINVKTGTRQTICTQAPFLLGAINREYHIPYTKSGIQKTIAIALASKDHTYRFSQADALKNVRPGYTPQILAQVQKRVRNISTPDLVKGLSYNRVLNSDGTLHDIYRKSGKWYAYRDALAYVLLERGLHAKVADITGSLRLVP